MTVDMSQAATALLTEHLQYTPLSLIDDIINAVNTYVYQAISSLETGLTSAPPERLGFKPTSKSAAESGADQSPDYPDAKKEIEEGLHQLETLLESTVDKNFDKLDIYILRNILSVPEDLASWVRLSHYESVTFPPPANVPTVEGIHLLRRKLAESRKVQHILAKESVRNETLINQLKTMISSTSTKSTAGDGAIHHPDLSFLTSSTAAQRLGVSGYKSQQPLTTNTTFALSQLPALRAALADLRPRLASLGSSSSNPETAKDELKQERRDYIEQRIQSHLERNGDVRMEDADAMNGRKIEKEEIEALEKAASMLGGHQLT